MHNALKMCVMTFYGCLLLLMVLQMFNTLEQTIEIEGLFTRERERERCMSHALNRSTIDKSLYEE